MIRHVYFLCFVLLLIACKSPYQKEICEALEQAGDNREELIKVLSYFKKKGAMQYESACYLISNMKYHKSIVNIHSDSLFESFFHRIDSIYLPNLGKITQEEVFLPTPFNEMQLLASKEFCKLLPLLHKQVYTSDLECVKADYLIDNIESAFEAWSTSPFLKNLSFEEFKESVLPYRTTDEARMFKRSTLCNRYKHVLISSEFTNVMEVLERYKEYVAKVRWVCKAVEPQKRMGFYDLFFFNYRSDCHTIANWTCNLLRSCGIPAVYEFTPLWKDRGSIHHWCASPDSSGIFQPYTPPNNNLGEDLEYYLSYAGKVYRKSYGANPASPYFLAHEDEYIPSVFLTPLIWDQTFRYHQTVTLRIPYGEELTNRMAYLCMGIKDNLSVVGWGVVDTDKKELVFEQVPLNTLFFPVYFQGEVMKSISSPFMIQTAAVRKDIPLPHMTNHLEKILDITRKADGLYLTKNITKKIDGLSYITLNCDTSLKRDLLLLRKYPEKRNLKVLYEKMKGNVWLGGNSIDKITDTLCVLDYVPFPYLQEIELKHPGKYRYYRYAAADGRSVDIAHMEFLSPFMYGYFLEKPTPLPIFEDKATNDKVDSGVYRIKGRPVVTEKSVELAFDGNMETYASSSVLDIDFRIPVEVTHIRFAPRNANNSIVPGNTYALMYYDGRWKKADVRKAKYNYVYFKNIPNATLYWLRNLTGGIEESSFFYINDKQYFLHVDTLPNNVVWNNQ